VSACSQCPNCMPGLRLCTHGYSTLQRACSCHVPRGQAVEEQQRRVKAKRAIQTSALSNKTAGARATCASFLTHKGNTKCGSKKHSTSCDVKCAVCVRVFAHALTCMCLLSGTHAAHVCTCAACARACACVHWSCCMCVRVRVHVCVRPGAQRAQPFAHQDLDGIQRQDALLSPALELPVRTNHHLRVHWAGGQALS